MVDWIGYPLFTENTVTGVIPTSCLDFHQEWKMRTNTGGSPLMTSTA